MSSKRDIILSQLELATSIYFKAEINIVTCGNCGSVLLHKVGQEKIKCYDCDRDMALSDCPDLFYSGMENSALYNGDKS